MSTFLIALSTWLHSLATVVFVGHYLFMSLVYLPVFERREQGNALRELLEEVSGCLALGVNSMLGILILMLTTAAQTV